MNIKAWWNWLAGWWGWLVTSSGDPTATSSTIKGGLKIALAQGLQMLGVACGFGVLCIGVDADGLNSAIEIIGNIVFWGLSIWGAIQSLIGLVRKWSQGRWSAAWKPS